ncbi:MAG TPA: solute carrier family 23 protein, partial [Mycobacterium sp.]
MIPLNWKPVASSTDDTFVVAPDERLSWPKTIGIGAQHVVAMFGATFLVPVLTGFPPATTLLFSGIGTLLFLIITGNRLPSYLGSSFSVIAPVVAATASHGAGSALGGLVAVGLILVIIGAVVHLVGTRWIDVVLPPVVTGAIVALIGFNLAPAAKGNFEKGPLVGIVTLVLLVGALAFFRGLLGRLAIFLAVVLGYLLALALGDVDTSGITSAAWLGLPQFQTPTFNLAVLPMFLPAVIALVAENIGHVFPQHRIYAGRAVFPVRRNGFAPALLPHTGRCLPPAEGKHVCCAVAAVGRSIGGRALRSAGLCGKRVEPRHVVAVV